MAIGLWNAPCCWSEEGELYSKGTCSGAGLSCCDVCHGYTNDYHTSHHLSSSITNNMIGGGGAYMVPHGWVHHQSLSVLM